MAEPNPGEMSSSDQNRIGRVMYWRDEDALYFAISWPAHLRVELRRGVVMCVTTVILILIAYTLRSHALPVTFFGTAAALSAVFIFILLIRIVFSRPKDRIRRSRLVDLQSPTIHLEDAGRGFYRLVIRDRVGYSWISVVNLTPAEAESLLSRVLDFTHLQFVAPPSQGFEVLPPK